MLIVVVLAGVTGRLLLDAIRPLLPPSSSSSTSPLPRNARSALSSLLAPPPSLCRPLYAHPNLCSDVMGLPLQSPPLFALFPSLRLRPLAARLSLPPPPCPLFLCIACSLPCLRLPDTRRKFPFPPRGRLEVADTHLGIPHEAEACTVGWLEKPSCLECLGPAVPPPLP